MSSTTVQSSTADPSATSGSRPQLPFVVYLLALGTFLMVTTEFVIAGILPEMAADLDISLAQTGLLVTVFAAGMIVGAPTMALLTLRMSKRLTLVLALIVFVAGHVVVAFGSDLPTLLIARFVTAIATGAFWAVAAVVATRAAGPGLGARALGIISAGGSLASVIGVPLGALIAQALGWRGTFWALAAIATLAAVLVAFLVPKEDASAPIVSVRHQLAGLKSGRMWLVLAACATTNAGVLAAYSYISPLLTDQAGVTSAAVPLVLTAFGVGSLIGTILGGRFGDAHPHLVTIITPIASMVLLTVIAVTVGAPAVTIVLVVLLGLFGLSANGVLIHLAVGFAGPGAALGSALCVSLFNLGTAIGTGVAGASLSWPVGVAGPAFVGAVAVALTLVPTVGLLIAARRRTATA